MLILSKDRRSIINTDHIWNIHTSGDGNKLVCEFGARDSCCAAVYETEEEAKAALLMLINTAMSGRHVFVMPDVQRVQAEIANIRRGQESRNSIDGKKTKGHGGS